MRPLVGIDRELFETLIEKPELAGIAVEVIDPDWFESMSAKMLLSAYQDLDIAGHELDADSLLLLIENDQLKNSIVTLQERIASRVAELPESPEERFAAIIAFYRKNELAAEKNKQIELLASASMEESEEDAMLKAMIEEQRTQQGIKNP
jgi:DNA primase